MSESENPLLTAGAAKPAQNLESEPENKSAAGPRNRLFLLLTLAYCVLAADTLLFNLPGLGTAAAVAGWYALALAYLGLKRLRRGEGRFLLAVNLLLALSLALTSNGWFRAWNCMALLALLPIHAAALSGAAERAWWQPSMLWERLWMLLQGLFGRLGAVADALCGEEKGGSSRRVWTAVIGSAAAAALVLALLPVLSSADALFSSVTEGFLRFCREHLTAGLARLLVGAGLTPFLFSLLTFLRAPQREKRGARAAKQADPLLFAILLGALDALYLLFIGVQAAGLFGGAEFLAARGISRAEWARSGFFQMTGVTAVNLSVLLAAAAFSRREGAAWRAARGLGLALSGQSAVLLASAVWRMSLYTGAYGLSFERCMTYWGMAMMAIFLAAALRKLLRPERSFCRVAFAAAVIGWVAVSFVPIDYLVAQNQVDRYLSGRSAAIDTQYLAYTLSYDALGPLGRLDENLPVDSGLCCREVLNDRRSAAREECAHWERWNLSAFLASQDS